MSFDSEQSAIQLLVLECVKALKQSSGPAASRFEDKLNKLIRDFETCKQDMKASMELVEVLNQALLDTRAQINEMDKKNEMSKDEIFTIKNIIDRNNDMIGQMTHSAECRNRQVSPPE